MFVEAWDSLVADSGRAWNTARFSSNIYPVYSVRDRSTGNRTQAKLSVTSKYQRLLTLFSVSVLL
jgi:hypothetical protein